MYCKITYCGKEYPMVINMRNVQHSNVTTLLFKVATLKINVKFFAISTE